jgi:hypothetical protein
MIDRPFVTKKPVTEALLLLGNNLDYADISISVRVLLFIVILFQVLLTNFFLRTCKIRILLAALIKIA